MTLKRRNLEANLGTAEKTRPGLARFAGGSTGSSAGRVDAGLGVSGGDGGGGGAAAVRSAHAHPQLLALMTQAGGIQPGAHARWAGRMQWERGAILPCNEEELYL